MFKKTTSFIFKVFERKYMNRSASKYRMNFKSLYSGSRKLMKKQRRE